MENGINLEKLLRDEPYRKPITCSKCGKMLTYLGVGEYRCEACGFTEFDEYGLVRAYVEKNPGATIAMVESATGVSSKVINGLVRSGKLDIRKGSGGILEGIND